MERNDEEWALHESRTAKDEIAQGTEKNYKLLKWKVGWLVGWQVGFSGLIKCNVDKIVIRHYKKRILFDIIIMRCYLTSLNVILFKIIKNIIKIRW